MKIAVEGCCHGELDKIYESITHLENKNKMKIDLLLICGDFQAVRNFDDLQAMAVPPKFQKLNSFYKYYSGERVAPVLTVFIGGNHEASNFMQELPYGGWVAKNIYYMGYAGIIQVGGIRIGGMSGIFKGHDFNKGHFERPPYDEKSKRSVYHVRNLEVFRLKQISRHVDIFLSHDWPEGIYFCGDVRRLIQRKPFFKDEIERDCLGSKPAAELLRHMKPSYWFAAHLHVKFAAHVEHEPSDTGDIKTTKFLALDKCLPRRQFLQVLDIPHSEEEGLKIKLDSEWLTILQSTNHLLHLSSYNRPMPGPHGNERYDFRASDSQLDETAEAFGNDLTLPENFEHTAAPIRGNPNAGRRAQRRPLAVTINPQTTLLCTMLNITDPNSMFADKTHQQFSGNGSGSPTVSDRKEFADDLNDTQDLTNDSPSFIDSSLDHSSLHSFNASSDFDSSAIAKVKKIHETIACNSNVVDEEDDEEELQAILSAQKKVTPDSSLINNTSPQREHESKDLGDCVKRPSIVDRLKALKSMDCQGLTDTNAPSEDFSQTDSSQSTSSLNKSNTVDFSGGEATSEPQDDHKCQKLTRSLTVPTQSSMGDVLEGTPAKKRNSTENDQVPAQDPQVSESMKKMKRRNVSVYEEQ